MATDAGYAADDLLRGNGNMTMPAHRRHEDAQRLEISDHCKRWART